MKELIQKILGAVLDLRVIVGLVGVVLSVAMHELFHIITHWSDIQSVGIFPDSQAIVEVVFAPTDDYDLVFEETIAYIITIVVLVLTTMLICEINDLRDEKTVRQTVLADSLIEYATPEDELLVYNQLGGLLGLNPIAPHEAGHK